MTLDTLLTHPEQAAGLSHAELAKLAMDATAVVALLCHQVVQRDHRNDGDDLLTAEQIAQALGIELAHAKALIKKALPKVMVGHTTVRVQRADLRQWIANRRVVRDTRRAPQIKRTA